MKSANPSHKLTLRLSGGLIARAKDFSQKSGKSVSQIVADYFASLPAPQVTTVEPPVLPPIVGSLYGMLKGLEVDEDDYHRHLERKYL